MLCRCKDAQCQPERCMDTAATLKFAKGLGIGCKWCGKQKKDHYHAQTYCSKSPYFLRVGATTCCNCWFAAPSMAPSFKQHGCVHCQARRVLLDCGSFAGVLHITVCSISGFADSEGGVSKPLLSTQAKGQAKVLKSHMYIVTF